jgi:dynamin 1-like protein
VELVHDELQRIVAQLENKELLRFANLREQVVEVVNSMLNNYKVPTKEMICNLIKIELAFINTNHPDFVGGDGAITTILEKMAKIESEKQAALNPAPQPGQPPVQQPARPTQPQPQPKVVQPPAQPPAVPAGPGNSAEQGFFNIFFGNKGNEGGMPSQTKPSTSSKLSEPKRVDNSLTQAKKRASTTTGQVTAERLPQVPATIKPINKPTDKENFETELIKHLLISYFDIVRKNVGDTVPKSIMHFLVNASKEHIQNELVAALYKEELFDHLLEESSVIAQKRTSCKAMMDILRKAHEILNEVRDFQIN